MLCIDVTTLDFSYVLRDELGESMESGKIFLTEKNLKVLEGPKNLPFKLVPISIWENSVSRSKKLLFSSRTPT